MTKIESLFDVNVISDQVVAYGLGTSAPGNPLGMYVLDEQGEPVPEPDTVQWAQWMEAAQKEGSRHLADDTVGPYRVSTIFLGLDHAFGGGPPVLWETIIFGTEEELEIIPGKPRKYRKTVDQFRYTSKGKALDGHARAVKFAESLPRPVTSGEAGI